MSPPAYRGVLTGLYNCTYYVGSITASGVPRATTVCLFVFFTSESPRWLYSHGKVDEARDAIIKYHGGGNPDSGRVTLQMAEYKANISLNGSDKRFWDFRELFNTRPARYRVLCMLIPSIFPQWSGAGISSYYFPSMLASAGVTNTVTVLNYNLGNILIGAFGAYLGASQVQRLGRRRTLIGVCIALSVIFACVTVGTGLYSRDHSSAAAKARIAFIFLFGFFFAFGWTPLQALYPVEVLSYEQRAKGMALSSVGVNAAALLNQFAMPVAMQKIGWHTYIVFVGWNLVQAVFCYFFAVETDGRTLEELTVVFAAPNPRKASTEKHAALIAVGNEKFTV
ncbi:general substrate transporter [Lipomyces kononenkoae]|uniref:General substrate transporter n=1 Tax=Lipomyces kononenkoae TaxID=34357 RepID=A0ACC3SQT9_LIPKO